MLGYRRTVLDDVGLPTGVVFDNSDLEDTIVHPFFPGKKVELCVGVGLLLISQAFLSLRYDKEMKTR